MPIRVNERRRCRLIWKCHPLKQLGNELYVEYSLLSCIRKHCDINRASAILKEDASEVKVDIRDKRLLKEVSHYSCALV
jgi:hypothetical protein